jgi:Ring finger domain
MAVVTMNTPPLSQSDNEFDHMNPVNYGYHHNAHHDASQGEGMQALGDDGPDPLPESDSDPAAAAVKVDESDNESDDDMALAGPIPAVVYDSPMLTTTGTGALGAGALVNTSDSAFVRGGTGDGNGTDDDHNHAGPGANNASSPDLFHPGVASTPEDDCGISQELRTRSHRTGIHAASMFRSQPDSPCPDEFGFDDGTPASPGLIRPSNYDYRVGMTPPSQHSRHSHAFNGQHPPLDLPPTQPPTQFPVSSIARPSSQAQNMTSSGIGAPKTYASAASSSRFFPPRQQQQQRRRQQQLGPTRNPTVENDALMTDALQQQMSPVIASQSDMIAQTPPKDVSTTVAANTPAPTTPQMSTKVDVSSPAKPDHNVTATSLESLTSPGGTPQQAGQLTPKRRPRARSRSRPRIRKPLYTESPDKSVDGLHDSIVASISTPQSTSGDNGGDSENDVAQGNDVLLPNAIHLLNRSSRKRKQQRNSNNNNASTLLHAGRHSSPSKYSRKVAASTVNKRRKRGKLHLMVAKDSSSRLSGMNAAAASNKGPSTSTDASAAAAATTAVSSTVPTSAGLHSKLRVAGLPTKLSMGKVSSSNNATTASASAAACASATDGVDAGTGISGCAIAASTSTAAPHIPIPKPRSTAADRRALEDNTHTHCPICMEPWTTTGRHRIVTLKCGHLFGRRCVQKWLQSNKSCPQCKKRSRTTDMIPIIVSRIAAVDRTRVEELEAKLKHQEDKSRGLHMQLRSAHDNAQSLHSKIQFLEDKLRHIMRTGSVAALPGRSAHNAPAVPANVETAAAAEIVVPMNASSSVVVGVMGPSNSGMTWAQQYRKSSATSIAKPMSRSGSNISDPGSTSSVNGHSSPHQADAVQSMSVSLAVPHRTHNDLNSNHFVRDEIISLLKGRVCCFPSDDGRSVVVSDIVAHQHGIRRVSMLDSRHNQFM